MCHIAGTFPNKSEENYLKCILLHVKVRYANIKLVDLVDVGQWRALDRLLKANRRLIFTGQLNGLQGGAHGAAGTDGTGGSRWLFRLWTFGWGEQDSWRESKIGLQERRKECFKDPAKCSLIETKLVVN